MKKTIRILEIPIYLLVIAIAIYEIESSFTIPVFLILISLLRLFVNVITDEFIYKG